MSIACCATPSSPIVDDIETFLRAAIADLAPDLAQPVGRGRPRILPAFGRSRTGLRAALGL